MFRGTEAGWVDFDVLPLTEGLGVQATHAGSPFDTMLRWLETVADGADTARWVVDGEGRSTKFVYLAPARHLFTRPRPLLLALDAGEEGDVCVAHIHVEAMALVRAFYGSFRRFAETIYEPHEWEYGAKLYRDGDSIWEGEPLRSLRSLRIEQALRSVATEQSEFDLRWPRRRRADP